MTFTKYLEIFFKNLNKTIHPEKKECFAISLATPFFNCRGHFVFQNIDLHHPSWLLMMVQNCDMWHIKKLLHGLLIILYKNFQNKKKL